MRLIDPDGKQVGVIPTGRALEMADSFGLDLVEVAPQVSPPVCRIMDYGRYKYEQTKKLQEAKKRQATYQIKEIKMRPRTEEHDLQVKLRHARKFLEGHDKVKLSIMFRGREMAYKTRGSEVLQRVAQDLADIAVIEQETKLEGRHMIMVLAPK